MYSSAQEKFLKDSSSFTHFPQFPPEVRNHIWQICVKDYPARIIDLREYRQPISQIPSPETPLTPNTLTECNSGECQHPHKTGPTEVVGFKSRVPAPTVLYVCRESRSIAQGSYTKAFGTAEMPAQTWIDFEKDMLYLSMEFCEVALEGHWNISLRFHNSGRKEPHGYFFKDQDFQKVKDLAVGGLWGLGSSLKTGRLEVSDRVYLYNNLVPILDTFLNLERFTLIDSQHSADLTGDLGFADESQYLYASEEHSDYQDRMKFREKMFDHFYGHGYESEIWASLKPYPWLEFGILVEKQQDYITTSGICPRKIGCRLATEEDRRRLCPWPHVRERASGKHAKLLGYV